MQPFAKEKYRTVPAQPSSQASEPPCAEADYGRKKASRTSAQGCPEEVEERRQEEEGTEGTKRSEGTEGKGEGEGEGQK